MKKDNPDIASEKMEFLASLMKEANKKKQSEVMPFLMSITQRANEKGIQFSDEETELLVRAMTANMSPAERKKVEMLRQMAKLIGKRKPQSKQ